jgi:hypothetical protein
MRTHNTPRLCAGPQTAGTPIKFWNVASIGDDEGEITLYGDVVTSMSARHILGLEQVRRVGLFRGRQGQEQHHHQDQ